MKKAIYLLHIISLLSVGCASALPVFNNHSYYTKQSLMPAGAGAIGWLCGSWIGRKLDNADSLSKRVQEDIDSRLDRFWCLAHQELVRQSYHHVATLLPDMVNSPDMIQPDVNNNLLNHIRCVKNCIHRINTQERNSLREVVNSNQDTGQIMRQVGQYRLHTAHVHDVVNQHLGACLMAAIMQQTCSYEYQTQFQHNTHTQSLLTYQNICSFAGVLIGGVFGYMCNYAMFS